MLISNLQVKRVKATIVSLKEDVKLEDEICNNGNSTSIHQKKQIAKVAGFDYAVSIGKVVAWLEIVSLEEQK